MGGQSGDIGVPGPSLCACGSVISRWETRCEPCKDLSTAKAAAARACKAAREHQRKIEAYRRQKTQHIRSTQTYRPCCVGCGKVFHTRSKVRLTCTNCADSAPGYEAKRASAANRGLGFHLTPQEWRTFIDKPCHYCGASFEGVRLDRVDSDGAYTVANVVSCCARCNMMKGTMPADMFKQHVARIALNWALKET